MIGRDFDAEDRADDRRVLAAFALMGLIARTRGATPPHPKNAAREAVEYADALLDTLDEKKAVPK